MYRYDPASGALEPLAQRPPRIGDRHVRPCLECAQEQHDPKMILGQVRGDLPMRLHALAFHQDVVRLYCGTDTFAGTRTANRPPSVAFCTSWENADTDVRLADR